MWHRMVWNSSFLLGKVSGSIQISMRQHKRWHFCSFWQNLIWKAQNVHMRRMLRSSATIHNTLRLTVLFFPILAYATCILYFRFQNILIFDIKFESEPWLKTICKEKDFIQDGKGWADAERLLASVENKTTRTPNLPTLYTCTSTSSY